MNSLEAALICPPIEGLPPLDPSLITAFKALPTNHLQPILDALQQHPQQVAAMQKVLWGSAFAAKWLCQNPEQLYTLINQPRALQFASTQAVYQYIWAQLPETPSEAALHKHLRLMRNQLMVNCIWQDFTRQCTTHTTCQQLSFLANACLQISLNLHYKWLVQDFGIPLNTQGEEQPFIILGMGKLGAEELNLSSDIDLIFCYPEAGKTQGAQKPSLDNQAFFTKLGQKIIQALDTVTADGFVFRVDMRLRPFGQSGALVSHFDALEHYYHTQGREWERFAMVKAQVVAHLAKPNHLHQLQQMLSQFTYRRYIDFSVIDALRKLKVMIIREVNKSGRQQDVKLGEGGIREIEFIAQIFQLIRGGKDLQLQQPQLIPTLKRLAQLHCLTEGVCQELINAYYFLRDTEHALQGYQDRQTQLLPTEPAQQMRLAWLMGFSDWPSYYQQLQLHRQWVSQEFNAVIALPEQNATGETAPLLTLQSLWLNTQETPAATAETLATLGFNQAEALATGLIQFKNNPVLATLHSQGQERLDAFLPKLLLHLHALPTPADTFSRLTPFIMAVARRSVYLVLLSENPQALEQLITLTANSVFIAEQLCKYPALLDELIDPVALYSIPIQHQMTQELQQWMLRIDPTDLEAQMENLRYFRNAIALKAAACEITGHLPLMKVSDTLSHLAEVILTYALHLCWQQLTLQYGYPDSQISATPGFIIVAYGKLGGLELGHGSDLDLVFIYNASPTGSTGGEGAVKSIDNSVFYTRLAQKMLHLLATKTAFGQVYDIDLRLRPSGNSGLLVSRLEAFEKYQMQSAWTWEHQALVRARPVAGCPQLAAAFEALRHRVLQQPRQLETLRAEVADMRAKMRLQLGSSKNQQEMGLFHLKQDAGGIVDIEFMVQYCLLAWAHAYPSLTRYTDNIRILGSLVSSGQLPAHQAEQLINAYKHYRSLGHKLAMQQASMLVARQPLQPYIQTVTELWQQWLAH